MGDGRSALRDLWNRYSVLRHEDNPICDGDNNCQPRVVCSCVFLNLRQSGRRAHTDHVARRDTINRPTAVSVIDTHVCLVQIEGYTHLQLVSPRVEVSWQVEIFRTVDRSDNPTVSV